MALTPEEQAELDQLLAAEGNSHSAPTGAGGAGAAGPPLEEMLDPNFNLIAQGLSVQPATTHPEGDEAAEAAWLRKPAEAAKGVVFFYEPPLEAVKKRLAEDQAFAQLVAPSMPMDPARIAGLTNEDSNVQAAKDFLWRESADAAAANGKTAYRYSKAPWLHDGSAMSGIRALGMKASGALDSAVSGVTSFVMGMDKTATLGAGRAVGESRFNPLDMEGSKLSPEQTTKERETPKMMGL